MPAYNSNTGELREEASHELKAGLGQEMKLCLKHKQTNQATKSHLKSQARKDKTNSPCYAEPLGGDSDPPDPHLPVDPRWQCPGGAAPACSPCLLPVEGKASF